MTDPATSTRPATVPGGQQDDPGTLRTDDFGLGGDMKDQLVEALTARWNADDPGATTLDDEADDKTADTAATPVPAPDPTPTDLPQGPDVDGAGGGGAAQGGEDAAASDPPDATSVPDSTEEFDLAKYAHDYFGTDLTREQSAELFGILNGLQRLSPEQRADLDRVLAGGQPNQYPATTGQPVTQQDLGIPAYTQPPPQPSQPGVDPAVNILGPRPDDDYAAQVWDMNAAVARNQQAQIDALNANIAQQTARDQQRQMSEASARITSAEQSWRASHPLLSDGEFDGLYAKAVASGQFPALLAANHNNHEAAVAQLFDQHFWADPQLREKAIANTASGRDPMDSSQPGTGDIARDQAATEQGRRVLAASVAGGGGNISAPPGSAPATPPTDPEARRQAMIQEIAAQHDFT